jgi:hypothetical protein
MLARVAKSTRYRLASTPLIETTWRTENVLVYRIYTCILGRFHLGTVQGPHINALALIVIFQACASLIREIIIHEERRNRNNIERCFGESGNGNWEIVAERDRAGSFKDGVSIGLSVKSISDSSVEVPIGRVASGLDLPLNVGQKRSDVYIVRNQRIR